MARWQYPIKSEPPRQAETTTIAQWGPILGTVPLRALGPPAIATTPIFLIPQAEAVAPAWIARPTLPIGPTYSDPVLAGAQPWIDLQGGSLVRSLDVRALRPTGARWPEPITPPVTTPTFFAGESPAFLFRTRPLLPPTGTRWAEPITPVVVPARSWASTYPDRIDRRRFLPAHQRFWTAPPNLTDLVTPVHGPAGGGGLARRPPLLLYLPWAGPVYTLQPLTDQPIYASEDGQATPRPPRVILYQAKALPPRSPITIPPAHSWHGSYPDRLVKPSLLAAIQRSLSAPSPLPLPATPAPTFSWQAISPTMTRRASYAIALRSGFAAPTLPITTPAPLLTFWWELPNQPVRLRPQSLGRLLSTPLVLGGGTLVGVVPGWEPRFPVWLPLHPDVALWAPSGGGLFPPGPLGAGYRVILLTDRGVRWTAITDEVVRRSAVTGEAVRWVRIEEEEVD